MSTTTTHTAPALLAAQAIVDLANLSAGTEGAAITCQAQLRLTPRIDSVSGMQQLPCLYAVPADDSIEPHDRARYAHTVKVILAYMVQADSDSAAMTAMDAFYQLVHGILAAKSQDNVKLLGADIDSFDFDALSDAGILATQAEMTCQLWTKEV